MTSAPFSFVFCTDRVAHLVEFANGLIALSSLMSFSKMELVVVAPKPLEPLMRTALKTLDRRRVEVVFCFCPWGFRGASRNLGFRAATRKWVYFIDQDVRIQASPELIAMLEGLEERESRIHLISGPYITESASTFWGRRYNRLSNLWLQNAAYGVRFLAGNVLMRKSAFEPAPFDERLATGGEEIELSERVLRRFGSIAAVYDERLAVLHPCDHSFRLFWRRQFEHARVKRRLLSEAGQTALPIFQLIRAMARPADLIAMLVTVLAISAGRMFPEKL